MPAEQAKLVLESEIIEVRIWNDTHAAVVAKRKDLRSAGPFDIRYLECIEGRWLNDGNDVCDTLEHARERIVQSEKTLGEDERIFPAKCRQIVGFLW